MKVAEETMVEEMKVAAQVEEMKVEVRWEEMKVGSGGGDEGGGLRWRR